MCYVVCLSKCTVSLKLQGLPLVVQFGYSVESCGKLNYEEKVKMKEREKEKEKVYMFPYFAFQVC